MVILNVLLPIYLDVFACDYAISDTSLFFLLACRRLLRKRASTIPLSFLCHDIRPPSFFFLFPFLTDLTFGVQGSGAVSKLVAVTKKEKAEVNRRRKQSMDLEEDDEENRDWWTKYFASLEAVAQVKVHS